MPELPEEVTHVPLWVKGLVLAGAILFALQIPTFTDSLSDAIQKKQALNAYNHGFYSQAIDQYKELCARYPDDRTLIKQLGFSYYSAGLYLEAAETFNRLAGIRMPRHEANEIESALSDIAEKLNSQEQ
jgi:tetratricopeptide (TPR) repeat protein